VCLLVFTPLAFGTVEPESFMVLELLTVGAVAAWLLKMVSAGNIVFVRTSLGAPLLLFIAYVVTQLLVGGTVSAECRVPALKGGMPNVPLSIYADATWGAFLKAAAYTLVFFVFVNNVHSREDIYRFLILIVSMGFLLSVLGIAQQLSNTERIFWQKKLPPEAANFFGPYVCRNHFSGYVGMVIPLSLALLMLPARELGRYTAGQADLQSFLSGPRPLFAFMTLITAAAWLSAGSRGGIVALLGALAFMAILLLSRQGERRRIWLIPAIATLVFILLLWLRTQWTVTGIPWLGDDDGGSGFQSRAAVWKGTIEMIRERPFWGTGLGTFRFSFPAYCPPEIRRFFSHAHNDYLELIAETGLAGALVIGLGICVWLSSAFRRLFRCRDSYTFIVATGGLASLFAFALHSVVDFNLHIGANATLLAVILGMVTVVLHSRQPRDNEELPMPAVTIPLTRRARFAVYPVLAAAVVSACIVIVRPALAKRAVREGRLERALRLTPRNAEIHYLLGKRAFREAKDAPHPLSSLKRALATFGKAADLNPTNGKYHQSLAWAYGQLAAMSGDVDEPEGPGVDHAQKAAFHFERATVCDPSNPYRHRAYAVWCFTRPDGKTIKRGMAAYRKAIELEPALAREALRACYEHEKNYQNLLRLLPGTPRSDHEFLRFLIEKENLAFAVAFAENFLQTYPENARMHFWIADRSFYDSAFPWEFTQYHYSVALEKDPDNAYYRMWHGIHLYHRHVYEEAAAELRKAIQMGLDPEDRKKAMTIAAKCRKARS